MQAYDKKRVKIFSLFFPDFSNVKDSAFCSFGYSFPCWHLSFSDLDSVHLARAWWCFLGDLASFDSSQHYRPL